MGEVRMKSWEAALRNWKRKWEERRSTTLSRPPDRMTLESELNSIREALKYEIDPAKTTPLKARRDQLKKILGIA